ncbi:MAG TPA: diacylglycerol kinase family protein [Candidatus Saccharimonadales bacterium]
MQNKNAENLIIVQNPNSTRADKIDEKVFAPLERHGIPYEVYHTESADTEQNIADMQEQIPADATVMIAAGDGTAMQAVNASLRSDKNWTLGFVPLGNFNDNAHSHAKRHHSVVDLLNAPEVNTHPLTIDVDGEYWRHAPAYMTIGWTALAASQFGDAESRKAMKDTPAALKLAKSLGQLAGNYIQNRRILLPSFTANGIYQDEATDILAINSPYVGGIVRSQDNYFDKSYFGSRADINVGRILPNVPFGLKAITGHAPSDRVEEMHLVFDEVAHLPVQTEGEFQWLDAKEIFVYKNPTDIIRVLHPKGIARR